MFSVWSFFLTFGGLFVIIFMWFTLIAEMCIKYIVAPIFSSTVPGWHSSIVVNESLDYDGEKFCMKTSWLLRRFSDGGVKCSPLPRASSLPKYSSRAFCPLIARIRVDNVKLVEIALRPSINLVIFLSRWRQFRPRPRFHHSTPLLESFPKSPAYLPWQTICRDRNGRKCPITLINLH